MKWKSYCFGLISQVSDIFDWDLTQDRWPAFLCTMQHCMAVWNFMVSGFPSKVKCMYIDDFGFPRGNFSSGNYFSSIFSLQMSDSRWLEMATTSQFCVWGVFLLLRMPLHIGQHVINARKLKMTRNISAYFVNEMLRLMSKNIYFCVEKYCKNWS